MRLAVNIGHGTCSHKSVIKYNHRRNYDFLV